MSSFLVSKVDFIKCAGFIAGIAESFNRNGHNEFFLWDTVENRITDTELFYKRFVQCFEMNAESVRQQYGDKAKEVDTNEYKTEFYDYRGRGKGLIFDTKEKQMQALSDIRFFFRGSIYQVENERYCFLMTHWFDQIMDQLTNLFLYRYYESSNWGSFELTSEKKPQTA